MTDLMIAGRVGTMELLVADSVEFEANCGHMVMLSPAGKAKVDQGDVEVQCIPCSGYSVPEMVSAIDSGEMRLAKGGLDEVAETFEHDPLAMLRAKLSGVREEEA